MMKTSAENRRSSVHLDYFSPDEGVGAMATVDQYRQFI